jgi:hypothetical protein
MEFGIFDHVERRDGLPGGRRVPLRRRADDDGARSEAASTVLVPRQCRVRGRPSADHRDRRASCRGQAAGRALSLDLVLAGTADALAHVSGLGDAARIDYFVGAFARGDLSHAEAMASLTLFADAVVRPIRS